MQHITGMKLPPLTFGSLPMEVETGIMRREKIKVHRIEVFQVHIKWNSNLVHVWFRGFDEDGNRLFTDSVYRSIDELDGRFEQALVGMKHEARQFLFESETVVEADEEANNPG